MTIQRDTDRAVGYSAMVDVIECLIVGEEGEDLGMPFHHVERNSGVHGLDLALILAHLRVKGHVAESVGSPGRWYRTMEL